MRPLLRRSRFATCCMSPDSRSVGTVTDPAAGAPPATVAWKPSSSLAFPARSNVSAPLLSAAAACNTSTPAPAAARRLDSVVRRAVCFGLGSKLSAHTAQRGGGPNAAANIDSIGDAG